MGFTTFEEIIKFAIKREETAYKLYSSASKKAKNPAARKMFEELAAEEAGHKVYFEKVKAEEVEKHKSVSIPDPQISDHMVDIPFREDLNIQEIVQFAMKTEESAYQLYKAASDMTPEPKLKKALMMLADVEKGHKQRLEAMFESNVFQEF